MYEKRNSYLSKRLHGVVVVLVVHVDWHRRRAKFTHAGPHPRSVFIQTLPWLWNCILRENGSFELARRGRVDIQLSAHPTGGSSRGDVSRYGDSFEVSVPRGLYFFLF